MSSALVSELLRSPATLARRCHDRVVLQQLGITSLACIAIGSGIFGGVLGATRGGAQIAYSSLKLPLSLLLTLCVAVPAFHAVARVIGRRWPLHVSVALSLAGLARFSLVLAALAPLLWLFIDTGASYHASIVLAALGYALAFVSALRVISAGLGSAPGRRLGLLAFTLVLTAAGSQAAWVLRPYIGRPAQDAVPFVRSIEGSFVDAVLTSGDSWSRGVPSQGRGRSR